MCIIILRSTYKLSFPFRQCEMLVCSHLHQDNLLCSRQMFEVLTQAMWNKHQLIYNENFRDLKCVDAISRVLSQSSRHQKKKKKKREKSPYQQIHLIPMAESCCYCSCLYYGQTAKNHDAAQADTGILHSLHHIHLHTRSYLTQGALCTPYTFFYWERIIHVTKLRCQRSMKGRMRCVRERERGGEREGDTQTDKRKKRQKHANTEREEGWQTRIHRETGNRGRLIEISTEWKQEKISGLFINTKFTNKRQTTNNHWQSTKERKRKVWQRLWRRKGDSSMEKVRKREIHSIYISTTGQAPMSWTTNQFRLILQDRLISS